MLCRIVGYNLKDASVADNHGESDGKKVSRDGRN